ncbi:unnamed protein product [Cochlearia groenlandica]
MLSCYRYKGVKEIKTRRKKRAVAIRPLASGTHAAVQVTGRFKKRSYTSESDSIIALEPFSASAQILSARVFSSLGDSRSRRSRCSAILGTRFLVARRFSVLDSSLPDDSRYRIPCCSATLGNSRHSVSLI